MAGNYSNTARCNNYPYSLEDSDEEDFDATQLNFKTDESARVNLVQREIEMVAMGPSRAAVEQPAPDVAVVANDEEDLPPPYSELPPLLPRPTTLPEYHLNLEDVRAPTGPRQRPIPRRARPRARRQRTSCGKWICNKILQHCLFDCNTVLFVWFFVTVAGLVYAFKYSTNHHKNTNSTDTDQI